MVRDNTPAFQGRVRESMILRSTYDTEEDWPELVKKWDEGISDLGDKAQLKEYTRTKIWLYEVESISDFTLWNQFRMDFEGFTAETFKKIGSSTLQSLRICLRCGGVWVPNNSKHLSIQDTFMTVLEEDE
jgi:hypothetical protein